MTDTARYTIHEIAEASGINVKTLNSRAKVFRDQGVFPKTQKRYTAFYTYEQALMLVKKPRRVTQAPRPACINELKRRMQNDGYPINKNSARKEDELREFLRHILDGEKLKTPRISVSYRTTPAVEIDDEDALIRWASTDERYEDCLRYKAPEISKTEVKRLIQEGVAVPGAALVERVSTQIR